MFQQLVCIESASRMTEDALTALAQYAHEVVLYHDIPNSKEEIQKRIGEADAILVSYTSNITADILDQAPNLRYIGMCCSLYDAKSANVDIVHAKDKGITVTGVYHYGDRGVPEFVVSELVRLLHGFGDLQWRAEPYELTGQKIGMLGLGTTGSMVAKALHFFGAHISYFSKERYPEMEQEYGFIYKTLRELLTEVDILCCCLNKNTILLHAEEFSLFGNGKILVNTSIGPVFDLSALEEWLTHRGNFALGDMRESIDPSGRLQALPNIISPQTSSGSTAQARKLLGAKVLERIQEYFAQL